MPVIACPGCGKQYKIAATAAGQVAKCACGKRFRLGGSPSSESSGSQPVAPKKASTKVAAASASAAVPQPKRAAVKAAAPAATPSATAANDDFWNDSLAIADAPKKPAEQPAASASTAKSLTGSPAAGASKTISSDAPKKKKKKARKIRWGFDWGKVVAGLGAFLIFGGLTVALVMSTGRVSRGTVYLAAPAIAGLFTAINGLMGEEGIW